MRPGLWPLRVRGSQVAGTQRRAVASAPPGGGSSCGPVEPPQPLIYHDMGRALSPRGQGAGTVATAFSATLRGPCTGNPICRLEGPEGSRPLNIRVKTLDSLDRENEKES